MKNGQIVNRVDKQIRSLYNKDGKFVGRLEFKPDPFEKDRASIHYYYVDKGFAAIYSNYAFDALYADFRAMTAEDVANYIDENYPQMDLEGNAFICKYCLN